MIHYPITRKAIKELIKAENPTWLDEATRLTNRFRTLGKYEKSSLGWSAVKPVYMKLQGSSKCAYCERKLEGLKYGKIEQDIEHFRPKGNLGVWPSSLVFKSIPFTTVPIKTGGYYLLAYDPLNYAAACKPCNSILKKNYFPMAGTYNLKGDDPASLKSERPYLIYPLGTSKGRPLDVDPEEIITFHGLSPRPVKQKGHARNRALVTIELFRLDNPSDRDSLFHHRALTIIGLYPVLQKTATGSSSQKSAARDRVKKWLRPSQLHVNCARSFARLFKSNPKQARAFYRLALAFVETSS